MAVGFVLITTEVGCEIDVREAVATVDGVVGQWIVFGPHDLFVKIEADDEADDEPKDPFGQSSGGQLCQRTEIGQL